MIFRWLPLLLTELRRLLFRRLLVFPSSADRISVRIPKDPFLESDCFKRGHRLAPSSFRRTTG
jgi:hypothetical protein